MNYWTSTPEAEYFDDSRQNRRNWKHSMLSIQIYPIRPPPKIAVGSACETLGETHLPPETSEGSFSAVSTPIFATKYSFCSIFRDLQDLHSFAPFFHRSEFINFVDFRQTFVIFCSKFCKFSYFLIKFIVFSTGFDENFSEFHEFAPSDTKFRKI